MLLFKPEHVPLILNGTKTETRRTWLKPRVRVGSIQQAKTVMMSRDYFAKLRILGVRRELFQSIDEAGARAEGGYTRDGYVRKFFEINPKVARLTSGGAIPFNVWVVTFELVKE